MLVTTIAAILIPILFCLGCVYFAKAYTGFHNYNLNKSLELTKETNSILREILAELRQNRGTQS
jgi:hypothetical protein